MLECPGDYPNVKPLSWSPIINIPNFLRARLHGEEAMAKIGSASLWLLLVVATCAQCVVGQIGYTYVHNSASFDVTHGKYVTHANGTQTIIHHSTLVQGTTEEFDVPVDVTCVSTSYLRLPEENFGQVVLDWCKTGMPVDCLPDCFWIVIDTGFYVTNNKYGALTFVAGWEPRSAA